MQTPTLRRRVATSLEVRLQRRRGLGFYVNLALSVLIFLNTVAIVLHTIPELKSRYDQFFIDFEVFSVIIFTIEYLVRVWASVEQKPYKHPFWGRLRFMVSAWGIVDLLAILPFYISFFTTDLGFIRILRLLRMLRLLRFSRYSHALRVIQRVVLSKKEELLLSMTFIFFLLLISSSLVFYIEHEAQPEVFASIPDSLWWGVNAMTTVGYGDMHPITPLGKLMGGLIAILGVSIFALPTGILASGFAEHVRRTQKLKLNKTHCPHCGHELEIINGHVVHQHFADEQ